MRKRAFTLVELLIVMGILAILGLAVVTIVNPVESLRQSRDAARLSDFNTLHTSVNYYLANGGSRLGTSSIIYVSLPDPLATSTAGDQCQGLGLPLPAPGWTYQCASPANYRNVDGTGWIPVNLRNVPTGSPLGSLPVDPASNASSGYYYTYATDGSGWAISTLLESQKYLKKYAAADGGYDWGRYEAGTNLALVGQQEGLAGWWKLDEGSGSAIADSSGNGNGGTWNGSLGSQWTTGKIGASAGNFNGTNNGADLGNGALLAIAGNVSMSAWAKFSTSQSNAVIAGKWGIQGSGYIIYVNDITPNAVTFCIFAATSQIRKCAATSGGYNDGNWHYYAGVYDGTNTKLYVDGATLIVGDATTESVKTSTDHFEFGEYLATQNGWFAGAVDDVRVYARALTAAEIAANYAAAN